MWVEYDMWLQKALIVASDALQRERLIIGSGYGLLSKRAPRHYLNHPNRVRQWQASLVIKSGTNNFLQGRIQAILQTMQLIEVEWHIYASVN